jgi:hypothetical protein
MIDLFFKVGAGNFFNDQSKCSLRKLDFRNLGFLRLLARAEELQKKIKK